MGLFDWLGGRKAAPSGVARQPVEVLRKRLLELNGEEAPFVVRDGAPEGVDLVADWKLADARWIEAFAKAGARKGFLVLMKFDTRRGEVRAVDRNFSVEWRAGLPTVSFEAEAFRGQTWERSYEAVYGFREDGTFGRIYAYDFDTGKIKPPLIGAAHSAGWAWRGVTFGRL